MYIISSIFITVQNTFLSNCAINAFENHLIHDKLKEKHVRRSSMTSKALWKERTLCTMYADMCLFTPWISIIGDAPNYRIPERMQIGTSLFPFSAPLYLPHVLPKRHSLILSSINHQLSYQENMRLKDKKGRSNESIGKREAERKRGLEMCRWLRRTVGG